jgi:hypothetical protein
MPSIIKAARLVGASDTYDLILSASTSVVFCCSNFSFNSIDSSFKVLVNFSNSSFNLASSQ